MNIVLTILLAILCFGIIVFIHEGGHFIAAKLFDFKVNEFSIGMGPKIYSFGKGETKYSLRALPIGGFVSMEGEDEESGDERSFTKKPAYQRLLVCVAGAVMNLILGFIILLIITSSFGNLIATKTIAKFEEGSSLSEKLQVDDRIVSVNNLNIYSINDVAYEFQRDVDKKCDITVIRNGERITLNDVPITTEVGEDGEETIVIDFKVYGVKKNVGNVIGEALTETVSNARMIFLSVVDLIKGRYSVNDLSGPVGVTTVISKAASYGIESLLSVMAFITINIGLFNLFPFPALDGGKIFLLIGEMIFKKRLSQKAEIAINLVGFGLLMLLMVFATYNDILRLF